MTTLARLFLRKDVAATWQSANPTLAAGEPGFESDQFRLRIGNGALAFNSLRAFLSVPTGAITVAQALLNASTQAAQRTALGITGDISQINALGGAAITVTDWNDVAASGSGIYQANAVAANRPDDVSLLGIYMKLDANNGVLVGWSGSSSGLRLWTRNYSSGAWGAWQSWAGTAVYANDWNAATTPGFWWGDGNSANGPAAYTLHGMMISRNAAEGTQIAWRAGADEMWYRRRSGGVWQQWRRVIDTGNLPAEVKAAFPSVPYTSTEQTITSGGLRTLAHGLGAAPSFFACRLKCATAEHNWTVGDEMQAELSPSGATTINSIWADATNVYVRYSNTANCFNGGNKTTGAAVTLTNANWRLIVRAYP